MKNVVNLFALLSLLFLFSCDKPTLTEDYQLLNTSTIGPDPTKPGTGMVRDTFRTQLYFEDHLLTAFLQGLSQNEITYIVGKHLPVGILYSYNDLHTPTQFLPVTGDIVGNFNIDPVWKEMMITFNAGFSPYQFTSVAELEAALHATNPEISVAESGDFYRYTIVGK